MMSQRLFHTPLWTLLGGLALVSTTFASAATGAATAQCDGVQQDRQACLREAGAARQAATRNGLSSAGADTYRRNALERCKLQQPADRPACEARVTGSGDTTIDGSVMGGGLIRETVTPITMPQSAPPPAMPSTPAMPAVQGSRP